jgi:hypothetical protein
MTTMTTKAAQPIVTQPVFGCVFTTGALAGRVGRPQFGQLIAVSEIWFLQSGQVINAI